MGQRLVVTIEGKDRKPLANVYMHWSAYTMSALNVTQDVISELETLISEGSYKDEVDLAVQAFLRALPGSGVSAESYETYYGTKMPEDYTSHLDRNEGLIGVEEKDMEDAKGWSEGDVFIDISDHNNIKVDFEVCYTMSVDDFIEDYCDGDESQYDPEILRKDFPMALLARWEEQRETGEYYLPLDEFRMFADIISESGEEAFLLPGDETLFGYIA